MLQGGPKITAVINGVMGVARVISPPIFWELLIAFLMEPTWEGPSPPGVLIIPLVFQSYLVSRY